MIRAAIAALFYFRYICKKYILKIRPLFFIPAIIWIIIIFILLTMPGSDVPEYPLLDVIQFDKWVHCGLFAALVFLCSFPLKKAFPHYAFIYLLIAILSLAYGIGMEYVQKYWKAIDRDFDVLDMAADGVGCVFGFLFIQWQLKRRNKKSSVVQ